MVLKNSKLLLIFSLILLNMREYNCTRISKGMENTIDVNRNKLSLIRTSISSSTMEKETHGGVPSVAEVERWRFHGWKMPLRASLKKKMGNKERLDTETPRTLGTGHFAGKLGHKGRRKLNVEHKLFKRHSRHNRKHDSDHSFMAFSADYHVPNHHPPRHN